MKTGCHCTEPCGMDGECSREPNNSTLLELDLSIEKLKEVWEDGINEGLERALAYDHGIKRKPETFESFYVSEWDDSREVPRQKKYFDPIIYNEARLFLAKTAHGSGMFTSFYNAQLLMIFCKKMMRKYEEDTRFRK